MRVPLAGLLLLAGAALWAEEPAPPAKPPESSAKPDPARHPWARFGVGTTQTTRHVVLADGKVTLEEEGSAELTAATGKDCTVTVYQGAGDKRVKAAEIVYALFDPACILMEAKAAEAFDPLRKIGVETVKAAGRSFACSVYEFSRKDQPAMQQIAVDDAGVLVRSATGANENGKLAKPVVTLLLKEKVTLNGKDRKVECRLYESEDKVLGETTQTWLSDEVPGGLVRAETVSRDEQGHEVREIFEVTGWKAVERK
ncbi:MAG: hypothetical protein KIS92_11585 [Planctomycetota bacterium]|nr:hypothetical protein [Planctomycetota bacterium]